MATISTSQDWDSAARTAGETITINSGATLTINTDTRYHKNAPASGTGSLGSITMSDVSGGTLLIDGRAVRLLPFTSGTGVVPAYDTDIVGDTSTATGKLLGVYTAINAAPTAVGAAMPASGFIKLKSASTSYNASETLTGIGASTNGVDVAGWIEVVCDDARNVTVARAQKFQVRSEWFYLDNTSGSRNQVIQLPTCGGGSNTYYAGVWIETAPASDTYEFWPAQLYSASLASGWFSTAKGTDERSKFVEMQAGGAIRIGTNASGDYGHLPVSGCKVRIPNVLLMACATGSRALNAVPNATVGSRPEFAVTAAGNIDIDGAMINWYVNLNQPYSVSLKNSAIIDNINIAECATEIICYDTGTGNYLNTDVNNVTLTSNLSGGDFRRCKFGRCGTRGSGDYAVYVAYCKGVTFTDCFFEGRIFRTHPSSHNLYIQFSENTTVIRPVLVGGNLGISQSTKTRVEDVVYADSYHTTSSATSAPVGVIALLTASTDTTITGGNWWSGIPNVHIDTAFVYSAGTTNLRWYNTGTPASPIVGGSVNTLLYAMNNSGNSVNVKIQRVYFDDLFRFHTTTNSSRGVVIENCAANYSDAITGFDCLDGIIKGLKSSAAHTSFTSVYGTIFYNIFTSATDGRVGITFNEETVTYASYIDKTGLTGASGFSSTGLLYLYNLNDVIIYEYPYYIKGYTGFAASDVVKGGVGTANIDVDYQIDVNDGAGFSAWKTATSANLSAETINEVDGFKLKIRCTCTSAASNYLNRLYFAMVTDATAQEELYPLDTYNLTFSGLQTGTKVAIREAGTENLLAIIEESGGEASYVLDDTQVGDEVDLVILAAGYILQKIQNYELVAANTEIPISQVVDYGYVPSSSETVTFNGTTKRIICDAATTSIDIVGVYSMWVDWFLTDDNMQYLAAFQDVGGNTIDSMAGTSVPVYTYLINGWRLAPDEADHTLAVTGGILLVEGGGDPFVDTAGAYTVRINYQQPVQAITVSTGGGGGASAADVWSYSTRALTSTGVSAIQSGLATSSEISSLNDVSVSDVVTGMQAVANDFKADVSALATQASVNTIDTNVDAILVDTNELQTNQGNWLTATGFATPTNVTTSQTAVQADIAALNDISSSDVNTQVTNALTSANVLTDADLEKIADIILRRSTANIEASSDGDAISLRSLYGMIAQGVHKTSISGSTLTVTQSDDSTTLGTRTITTDANAEPITGLDTD